MRASSRIIIGWIVIVFLLVDIFIFDFLSYPRQFILRAAFRPPHNDQADLQAENQSLRDRIIELEKIVPQRIGGRTFIEAPVFATSPFSGHFRVEVGVGDIHDVRLLNPVTVMYNGEQFIFGKVERVSQYTSLVQTIFDSKWRGAVRIGDQGISALLEGGMPPRVVLIPRGKGIKTGDAVYASSADMPHGIVIGFIGHITENRETLSEEARLEIPYRVRDITTVFIARQ